MAMTVEIWEDSGVVGSPPAPVVRQEVNNVGWKWSMLDETYPYADYPLQRPDPPLSEYHTSGCKYNYGKIQGTYVAATRVRIHLDGNVIGAPPLGYDGTTKVRLYYRLTNVYNHPASFDEHDLISGTYIVPGQSVTLAPFLSTTDPRNATSFVNQLAANTTYYTNYIITQLYVEEGAWNEYGNIGEFFIRITVDEYETTDI